MIRKAALFQEKHSDVLGRARMCQRSRFVLLAAAIAWLMLESVSVAQEIAIERLIRFSSEVRSMESSSSFQRLRQRAAVLSNDAARQNDMETATNMAQMASERVIQGGTSGRPLSANVIGAVIAAKLAPERILQAAPLVSPDARRQLAAALEDNPEIKKRVANIDQIFASPSPSVRQQQASRLEAIRHAGVQAITTITDLYKQGAQKCDFNEEANRREIDRLSKDLLELSRLKAECAAMSNDEIMEDPHCRCLVHPSDPACRCRVNPKQPICQVRNPCNGQGVSPWTRPPTERGIEIENGLAETEYSESKGYSHVGATYGGTFPHLDFICGYDTAVQLKTIDTTGSSWPARTRVVIRKLAEVKLSNDKIKQFLLDVRVRRGQVAAATKELAAYGKELGVDVVVKECE
jgi:hypothetical protein